MGKLTKTMKRLAKMQNIAELEKLTELKNRLEEPYDHEEQFQSLENSMQSLGTAIAYLDRSNLQDDVIVALRNNQQQIMDSIEQLSASVADNSKSILIEMMEDIEHLLSKRVSTFKVIRDPAGNLIDRIEVVTESPEKKPKRKTKDKKTANLLHLGNDAE